MAITVVYIIKKKGFNSVHDIVTHSDHNWFQSGSFYVTGGMREELEKTYPKTEFDIEVDVLTHVGNSSDLGS